MQVRSNFLFAEVIHQAVPIFAFDDVKVHGMFLRVLALRQGKREVAKGQIVLIGDPPSLLVVFGQVLEGKRTLASVSWVRLAQHGVTVAWDDLTWVQI